MSGLKAMAIWAKYTQVLDPVITVIAIYMVELQW
jgi:hypothetical protein